MLEIKNLQVSLAEEDKEILKVSISPLRRARCTRLWGRMGQANQHCPTCCQAKMDMRLQVGQPALMVKTCWNWNQKSVAAAGLFLAFQYPVEIPGVGNMTFLRTAVNAQRKARGEEEMSAAEFLKVVRERAKTLKIDADMLKRPVNVGFSGGEKKRNEILQMAMLEPKMCILDETDSGLDVDAMKLVSEGVNALRDEGRGFLVITHYQRLLDHIKPDVVHIMANGRIVKTGGPELALEVEQNGYADILAEVA